MKIEMWAVEKVKPYEKNPRLNDAAVDAVARSISEFGWNQPVVVDRNGVIICGHTRLKAALKLGLKEVPVHVAARLTPTQVKAYRIADNKLAELAEWNMELLPIELGELKAEGVDMELLGFTVDEAGNIMGGEPADAEPQMDRAAELNKRWKVKPGDLWRIGEHRLLCGDSTKAEDVARVMNGEKIAVAFTSPPYASQREYDPASGFKPIPPDDYVSWWAAIQENVKTHLLPDGSFFVNIKEACDEGERQLYVKDLTIAHVREWGWKFVDEFCWTHGGCPRAVVRRFKNGWEPVFQFTRGEHKFKPDAVMHESESAILGFKANGQIGRSGHPSDQKKQGRRFNKPKGTSEGMGGMGGMGDAVGARAAGLVGIGMAYPSNVLSVGKNADALGHSAAFPVGLPAFFIKAYSDEGDAVFDPFAGSGTTLVACENLKRKCRAIELAAPYVAVCLERMKTAFPKIQIERMK